MKAIGYLKPQSIDASDALIDIQLPMPEATGRDLLVRVDAISVNPVDTKVRSSAAPNEGQHKVLGWDAVGEVVATGPLVSHYKPGDRVWYAGDITRTGTNAQYHLVDERIAGRQPRSLSDAQAAAMPLTTITAWELLFDRLGFVPDTDALKSERARLLIVGAAGGVGSMLIQLAARLTGATVIATASRPETQAWVAALGADYVIDHRQPLEQELQRIGFDSVTHVVSLTHTEQHFDALVEILAPQGKLALIDDPAQVPDIRKLKRKSISLHWELMFTRALFETEDMDQQRALLNTVADLVDDGLIKTTLGEHYGVINAANLKRAHTLLESGKAIGKIVLEGF